MTLVDLTGLAAMRLPHMLLAQQAARPLVVAIGMLLLLLLILALLLALVLLLVARSMRRARIRREALGRTGAQAWQHGPSLAESGQTRQEEP